MSKILSWLDHKWSKRGAVKIGCTDFRHPKVHSMNFRKLKKRTV